MRVVKLVRPARLKVILADVQSFIHILLRLIILLVRLIVEVCLVHPFLLVIVESALIFVFVHIVLFILVVIRFILKLILVFV